MLWRNMAAMAIEEMLRANPIDGVVLLGGCDKTIPALLMAAASVDLPAVVVPGGPMLTGTFRGEPLGCGTDVWRLSEEVRAGTLSRAGVPAVGVVDDPQPRALQHDGHRLDDGAASPRRSARRSPASPARRRPTAGCSRARTTPAGSPSSWSRADRRPSQRPDPRRRSSTRSSRSPRSAARPTPSCTCSRSPAGSASTLTLDDFDRIGSGVPLLVDLQPAGRFLMEDFHRAGGLLAVLREVRDLLDPDRADRHRAARSSTTSTTPQIWDARSSGRRAQPLQDARRHRRAARQPRPGRRGHQAAAASPRAAPAPRPGRGLRLDRGLPRPHRRSRPRRRRRLGARAARLRAAGYPGMPEVAQHAAAGQAAGAGRARHGPDLRRPDERHGVRHRGAARRRRRRRPAVRSPCVRTGDVIVLDVAGRRLDVELPPRSWPRASRRP